MRYPNFLDDNKTIGFVAPSFGCATEPYFSGFNKALDNFKSRGYEVWLGPNCYEDKGIGISNTPLLCGEELTKAYCSEEAQVLISCGGGELMCETLNFVDFEKIRHSNPKWYLGYSDNTNFTFLQNTLCDTAAIYGSCAAAFGMEKWFDSLEDTFSILTGKGFETREEALCKTIKGYPLWERESLKTPENPAPEYNLTEKKQLKCFVGSKEVDAVPRLSGRLVGGCVDCLVNLLGTKFDKVDEFNDKYAKDGIIWFLESCDLNVFSIRRAMWQMENAGWFQHIKGFLIGRPLCFGQEMMGLDQYNAVTGILGKYNVPIIMDCDFGHLSPSLPIVSGAFADVTADTNNIEITYSFK